MGSKTGASKIRPNFAITPEMRTWAEAKVPRVDIELETEKFVDYFLACGKAMADWDATWRNWMRRCTLFKGAALKQAPPDRQQQTSLGRDIWALE